jgi:pimeloyl-ACP methyl ester carboxylesterase
MPEPSDQERSNDMSVTSGGQRLLVFVPDSTGTMTAMQSLVDFLKLQPELQNEDYLPLPFKMSRWNNRDLREIANELGAQIEARFAGGGVSKITLCGYSLGVLLARRAYLNAMGYGTPMFDQEWAKQVDRIVFIGAICRGFDPDRFSWFQRTGIALLKLLRRGKAIRSAFVGSPFVSNVRLDWIRCWQTEVKPPMVVNFRGAADTIVRIEDTLDILQRDTREIVIPNANHDTVVEVTGKQGSLYRRGFIHENPAPPRVNSAQTYKRVYIVLHGMRSSKKFMTKLSETIQRRDKEAKVSLPDYGYIPIGPFLSRAHRTAKVGRFVDEYIQLLAANPNAEFFFAGHSNGTAILGQALLDTPGMRFKRLYLGGSALPTHFDWTTVVDKRSQVSEFIRSDRGSRDVAVGVFARAVQALSRHVPTFRGLGSAGYDGFDWGNQNVLNEPFVDGCHSAMIEPNRFRSIVDFLMSPGRRVPKQMPIVDRWWFPILHKHAALLVPTGVGAIIALITMLLVAGFLPIPILSIGAPFVGLGLAAVLMFIILRF